MIGFTPEECIRARLRSRRKFQTDMQSDLATAEDNVRKLGRAEAEAKVEGRAEAKIEIARKMLQLGFSPDQITAATDLTPEELEALL